MSQPEFSRIINDNFSWLPFILPESKAGIKVLKVDENIGRAMIKIKLAPGTWTPRYFYFCRAIAYPSMAVGLMTVVALAKEMLRLNLKEGFTMLQVLMAQK